MKDRQTDRLTKNLLIQRQNQDVILSHVGHRHTLTSGNTLWNSHTNHGGRRAEIYGQTNKQITNKQTPEPTNKQPTELTVGSGHKPSSPFSHVSCWPHLDSMEHSLVLSHQPQSNLLSSIRHLPQLVLGIAHLQRVTTRKKERKTCFYLFQGVMAEWLRAPNSSSGG